MHIKISLSSIRKTILMDSKGERRAWRNPNSIRFNQEFCSKSMESVLIAVLFLITLVPLSFERACEGHKLHRGGDHAGSTLVLNYTLSLPLIYYNIQ